MSKGYKEVNVGLYALTVNTMRKSKTFNIKHNSTFSVLGVFMTVRGFEDLMRHVGHRIECVRYSDGETVYGVSLECVTCGEVLVSFDNPEFVRECLEDCDDEPLCDCVHWGENVFPYFDDGCHLGYSYCNPEKCDDYRPIKQNTP